MLFINVNKSEIIDYTGSRLQRIRILRAPGCSDQILFLMKE